MWIHVKHQWLQKMLGNHLDVKYSLVSVLSDPIAWFEPYRAHIPLGSQATSKASFANINQKGELPVIQ